MKDIWIPVSGAIAQQKQVETIANNIANINTPGFKKDRMVFKEYLTAMEKGVEDIQLPHKEWAPSDFYKSYGAENAYVNSEGSYTDHNQGQLTPTQNPLDLAINGPGFFEVLSPAGLRYTRAGSFSISNDGYLVTSGGHKVLSKLSGLNTEKQQENAKTPSPEKRFIKIESPKNISISNSGDLYIDGQKKSTLSIIEFNDLITLRKEGNDLYINQHLSNRKDPSESTLHQGFIEQSNVNAVNEMSSLIKANRQFESIQRVIKAYDNIAGKEVNEISKF